MRFLKLLLFSVFFLFIIITGVGLLFPSTVIVSRATDIAAPKDSILNKLQTLQGWQMWVQGMKTDAAKISSATIAKLGNTNVKINVSTDSLVTSDWVDAKGHLQESTMRLIYQPNTNKAVVQWQFVEKLQWYPWQRLSSMMNDKILGEQLEHNLANLKKICEQ
jgi:hypothetical protein